MKKLLFFTLVITSLLSIPALAFETNPWEQVTSVPALLSDAWSGDSPRLVMNQDTDGMLYLTSACPGHPGTPGAPYYGAMIWQYDPDADLFTLIGSNVFTRFDDYNIAYGEGASSYVKKDNCVVTGGHCPADGWSYIASDIDNVAPDATLFPSGARFSTVNNSMQLNYFDIYDIARNASGFVTGLTAAGMQRGDGSIANGDAVVVMRFTPYLTNDIPQIGGGDVTVLYSGNPPEEAKAYPSVGLEYGGKYYTIGGNHTSELMGDGFGSTNIWCWPTPRAGAAAFTNYHFATLPTEREVGRKYTVSMAVSPSDNGPVLWCSYYNFTNGFAAREIALFSLDTGEYLQSLALPPTTEGEYMGSLAYAGEYMYVGMGGSLNLYRMQVVPEPAVISILASFALLFLRRK